MLTVITPTAIRHGALAQAWKVRHVDERGEYRLEVIAKNRSDAIAIARAHIEQLHTWPQGNTYPAPGSIAGWTDCDGPDLGPEAA